jgi:hypothetical protein
LQRQNVVADNALQPFHAIIAGHANFATVREVGEPDCSADGSVFRDPIAIVGRHVPPCNLFKGRAEFPMMVVQSGLFHDVAEKLSAISSDPKIHE